MKSLSALAMMAGIAAATMALSAPAQARPDTTRMSCPAARDMVSRYGAIVMNTGGHTFDRFVSNRGYCTPQEDIKPAFVPDRNGRSCFVGYTCEPIEPPEHFD